MKVRQGAVGMSLLDVISCALGAAVILAVIFSRIQTPIPSPVAGEFILVEVEYRGEAELGFRIETAGREVPIIPVSRNQQGVGHILEAEGLSESVEYRRVTDTQAPRVTVTYLLIEAPAAGLWKIEPFFYDFSEMVLRVKDELSSRVQSTTVNIWTRQGLECCDESSPLELDSPGEIHLIGADQEPIMISEDT